MKYWIADIFERNGEFEYTTPIHETFDTYAEAEKRMLQLKNEAEVKEEENN